ncbi:MAG: RNA methyltransferase, partial [Prosthecobacter sp.]|nr:RNA methyltransferase [Prosthecobacter sp.]
VRDGREPGLMFLDGLRLAEEALRSGLAIEAAFAASGRAEARLLRLVEALGQRMVPVFWTQAEVLHTLSDTVQSQGLVLIARRLALELGGFFQKKGSLYLALDRVQDPGNMGTLLRTAEAAGVDGVISLGGSVDLFSPKVLRSAMGAAFRLPVLVGLAAEALPGVCAQHGLHLAAATGEGETDYTAHDWQTPTVLILGNEGQGVSPALLAACHSRLHIPLANGVESLNVAAAGAVLLFEAARQRRKPATASL